MSQVDVSVQAQREFNINFQDLLELTNACFQSKNYLNNFPQVFKEVYKDFLFLLKKNKDSVSFCSLFPLSFTLNSKQRISAYCIGSVCTHPNFRNQGLALQTIQLAENKARENHADFLLLFADNNQLYAKMGFVSIGKTYLAPISKSIENKNYYENYLNLNNHIKSLNSLNNIIYKNFCNLDQLSENLKAKIWNFIILNSKHSESILSYLEFKEILKIKNMHLFIAEINEKIMAISFLNKGDDFRNVVHANYYNNRNYILKLIQYILKINNENDLIFFPGAFHNDFKDMFNYINLPLMSIKSLNEKKFPIKLLNNLCSNDCFFVTSLQGT